jgi:hypothetical protein
MLTVVPGLAGVPLLDQNEPVVGCRVQLDRHRIHCDLANHLALAGSITATRFSPDNVTKANRPSGVKPACAGPLPTAIWLTCFRRSVSITDTVPPLRLATHARLPWGRQLALRDVPVLSKPRC